MFKYGQCKTITQPREPMTMKVVERRPRKYSNGFIGWEIVKEIGICLRCAKGEKNVQ